jgi:hypothetical protein
MVQGPGAPKKEASPEGPALEVLERMPERPALCALQQLSSQLQATMLRMRNMQRARPRESDEL